MLTNLLKKYSVSLDGSRYDIIIGRELTGGIGALLASRTRDDRVLVVADAFLVERIAPLVDGLRRAGFSAETCALDAGKTHKTISEAMKLYEALEDGGFARDSTLIAVGGGVIGDLAGFVASTYLRGMNLVHVPTSLTAMVDSSIGGKVAINFRKTVNAIGNYYHPAFNVVDLEYLDTLPDRDYRAGLAEVIKCAMLGDAELFEFLMDDSGAVLARREDALLRAICRAIEIKLDHVANDVKEADKRLKLNYGHTLGHAIEVSTGVFDEVYRHGEGVSIGMVGAAHIARDYFGCGGAVLEAHERVAREYGLPARVETAEIGFDPSRLKAECMKNVFKDKKRKDQKLRFILPRGIGECGIYSDVDSSMITRAFEYLIR